SGDSTIASTSRGIYRCTLRPAPQCALIAPVVVRSILRGADGRLWVARVDGVRVAPDTGGLLQLTAISLGGSYRIRRLAAISDGIIAATEEGRVILLGDRGPQTLFVSEKND